MFTRTSKYKEAVRVGERLAHKLDEAQITASVYKRKFYDVLDEYNELIRRINKLGGESFLRTGEVERDKPAQQFTDEEIKVLISLCHPDRHGGKESATRMTTKLLQMRRG